MKTKPESRRQVVLFPMMIGFAFAFLLASPQAGFAQWTTNGSNNIYYNSGTVGIGTNSPSALLDIQGTSTGDTLLRVWNPSSSGTGTTTLRLANSSAQVGGSRLQFTDSLYYVGMITGDRTNGLSFRTGTNAGAESSLYDRMTILPGGNVGIGTTNPSVGKLQVRGGNGQQVFLDNAGEQFTQITFANNGGQKGEIWWDQTGTLLNVGASAASSKLVFRTANTTAVTIDASQKVGIGTATPQYKLDVAGTINATGLNINGTPITVGTSSVFGRTGAVVAATNDYTWAQINKSTSSLADINIRSASDLSSGTLPDARFPGTLPSASGVNLTALNGSSLASGTVATARLGSGTANATTFLRGDNTWAVPSGGSQWTTSGTNINYAPSGNVGIGTSDPTFKLHVTGNGKFTGNLTVDGNIAAKYQDMAEWVPSSEQLPTATVVVLDATKSNQVVRSTRAYDTRVAGVISEQPGIALGESGAGRVLVATTGRVRVKVDASRAPIQIGDLLVTSDMPGVAMKSEAVNLGGVQFHRPGTLIGKALEPLAKGSGEILVLLSLQ